MKHTLLFAMSLLLTACSSGTGGPVLDGRKFLESFSGPNVPTMKDALVESAQAAERKGNIEQAATLYEQALEKRPKDPQVLSSYGELLRRSEQYDKALLAFERALASETNYPPALEGKGLTQMARGSFDAAATTLGQAYKADATRWRTLNGLGILFSRKGMHPEAQQYFTEALKQSPNNPSILNNNGLARALDRDYPGAVSTLTQASKLTVGGSADRKQIDLNLALVHAVSGHLQEARNIAAIYYTGAALDNNMGVYAYLARDETLAKTYLNMALSESKTYYERAWSNLETMNTLQKSTPNAKSIKIAEPEQNQTLPVSPFGTGNSRSTPGSAPATVEATQNDSSTNKRRPLMQDTAPISKNVGSDLRMLPKVIVQPPVDAIGDSDTPQSNEVVLEGDSSTDAEISEEADGKQQDTEKSDQDSDAVSRFFKDIFKPAP